jgi:hypothetical protein
MRPRKAHFDDVINDYKEVEIHDENPGDVAASFNELRGCFLSKLESTAQADAKALEWLPPHALMYPAASESSQQLKPHVDSVRFSGSFVCGYTLIGGEDRLLRLVWDEHSAVEHPLRTTPAAHEPPFMVDIPLPSNSGYILSGHSRYDMTHEVIGSGASDRIAVILRDVLKEDRVKFGMDEKFLNKSV